MEIEKFYKDILDNLYDGIYFVDSNRKIIYWNKGAERITGYSSSEVVGKHCYNNILNHVSKAGICMCTGECPLRHTIKDGQSRETEAYLHHKSGYRVPVNIRTSPILDEQGRPTGAVEVFNDNSTHLQALKQISILEEAVYKDVLTDLFNRAYIGIKIESSLIEFQTHHIPLGILFIDLDKFKAINDTYGHGVGDQVLKMVAKTLSLSMRSTDVVGRWGGEEFVAVVQNIDAENLALLAEKLRFLIETSSMEYEGNEIRVTISIGATLARAGETLPDLLARADHAQYVSKANGRNRVTIE